MNWGDVATAAVTLFLIMDPLGNVPLFNAILSNLDPKRRSRVVARELVIALIILLAFLFAGNSILAFLGLSQSSLNIAGGVLLFIISLRMIFPGRRDSADDVEDEEPFIVPLAMPMIAGPSVLAALILLANQDHSRMLDWSMALGAAWLATAVIIMLSGTFHRVLGERGLTAIERLMGMILIMISIQMLLDGIGNYYSLGNS